MRHIRPHGLATRPAGAFSHASPVLRLVWPALRAGERAQRLAASWPWRATCISMALHVAAILAVIAWVPSPQKSAASVATEVAFWPGPEAPSGAVQAPSAQLPAEPLTEVKTAVADAAPAVPETTRAVEPSANTPAASPTAPPDVSAVPVAATTAEAVPVETAEALREPPPVQVARALPSPPAPRPAPAKPVAAKPAAVKAPPPAARPAETSAPAPVAGAPTNAPSTTVAALPAAAADSAEPPVVYEPRYRIPPTPPRFPPRALELNQQGTVVVRALVAPDGTSGEIIVWRSSGYALLDAAALRAVRDWAFEPASVGGRRIASWVEVPVRFAIR